MYEVNDTIVLVFLSRTIGSEAAGSEDILIKNLMKTIEPIAESHLYLNINTSCCETVHPHVLMENRTKSKNIHISPFFLICARSIYCTSVHPRREIARLFLFLRIPPFFFFFSCYKEFWCLGSFSSLESKDRSPYRLRSPRRECDFAPYK